MVLGRFGGGFERGRLRFLGRVSGFGPSFGESVKGPAGGVFGLGSLGVAACVQSLGRLRVVACATTDVGLVGGRGRRTTVTRTNYSLWWGIEGEVGLEYAVRPRLALAVRADGGGVPAQPSLVVDDQGRACCVEWGAGLRFGVVGRFGERVR
jgi:hypothetical protein